MNIANNIKVVSTLTLVLTIGLSIYYLKEKKIDLSIAPEINTAHYQTENNQNKLSEITVDETDEMSLVVTKVKPYSSSNEPKCDITANVLPVRLTISGGDKIKAFGSYISEDYLFSTLEKHSYDCESVKLYFSLEEGVTDDYLNQLIAKIDKLKVTQVYRPAILHAPVSPLTL